MGLGLGSLLHTGVTASAAMRALHTNSVAITDPLQLYQSYVTRGILKGDESQFRAAQRFQSLYYRLREYEPPKKAEVELRRTIREIEAKYQSNGFIEGLKPQWFLNKEAAKRQRQLVRVLSYEEELEKMEHIPKGFLLNGEVGCGKSMLMDIFANSLPYASKGRWHYHNFMLYVYDQINRIQQRRNVTNRFTNHGFLAMENELILFEIASNMINRNTVLILDEFALPDIAAAKITKLLFTYFFKMGGVLVATSNRLPEDLYATDFRKREFREFLTILESRCESLDMDSNRDYRKILSEESHDAVDSRHVVGTELWDTTVEKYFLHTFGSAVAARVDSLAESDSLTVYGREVTMPWHYRGVVKLDFDFICRGLFGPADYISMASKYHTFIVNNVPVFDVSIKSEARRFITLLDALYESKCQLLIQTEVELDKLFFPKEKSAAVGSNILSVQEEEMYSKTQLDSLSPYRPNVAEYVGGNSDFKDKMGINNKEETNFTKVEKFTGEDEKFAYKRAVSRVEEMTRSVSWRKNKQWAPLSQAMRMWENPSTQPEPRFTPEVADTPDPLVQRQQRAPGFANGHFWSLGVWGSGKRLKDEIAKKWIRGTEKHQT